MIFARRGADINCFVALDQAGAGVTAVGFGGILAPLVETGMAAMVWGRVATAAGAVALAGGLAFGAVQLIAAQERAAARQSVSERVAGLARQSLAPGSPLACLDGLTGPTGEDACEPVLFGRPETVAAALAHVSAQLALASEAATASDPAVVRLIAPMRASLSADRYGLAAHVLARGGCTEDRCEAAAILDDPERIHRHLRSRTFETTIARYAPNWPTAARFGAGGVGPSAVSAAPAPGSDAAPEGARKGQPTKYDFPSAASIPPVSIMDPEPTPGASPARAPRPTGSPAAAPAAAPAAGATAQPPARRPPPPKPPAPATATRPAGGESPAAAPPAPAAPISGGSGAATP